MDTTRNQRTIAARATVEGFGYWEGRNVRLEFHPAEPDAGIVFVRRDLAGRPRIAAHVANRMETPRRTTIRVGDARVEMIEHVMAALAGLEIDNCEVWTDQAEMPGCDGSSEPFVRALDAVGIVSQDARRTSRVLSAPTRLGDAASWVEARPSRDTTTVLHYQLDYGGQGTIGRQTFELALTPESFRRELCLAAPSCSRRRPTGSSPRAWAAASPAATFWSSASGGRSTIRCDSPMNASATRCWT